jgi:hypothetical protein
MLRLPSRDALKSLRSFARELITIIAGILIALAFDGMADRHQERKLAQEAVANMRSEIADNRNDLNGARKGYPGMRKHLEENLAAIGMLQRGEKPKSFTRRIPLHTVGLTDSSLETAQATGALRHMDYAEARRYADLFAVQAEFLRQQARLVDHWVATTPPDEEDLFALPPAELPARAAQLTLSMRYLAAVQRWAEILSGMYASRLRPGQ